MRSRRHAGPWLLAAGMLLLAGCASSDSGGTGATGGDEAAGKPAPKKESSGWFGWMPSLSSLNPFAGKEATPEAKAAAEADHAKTVAAEAAKPFTPARLAADMDALAKAVEAEKEFHRSNKDPLDAADAAKADALRKAVDAAREKVARTLNAPGGPGKQPAPLADTAAPPRAKPAKPADKDAVRKPDARNLAAAKDELTKAVEAEKEFRRTRKSPPDPADAAKADALRKAVDAAREKVARALNAPGATEPKAAPAVVRSPADAKPLPPAPANLTASLPAIPEARPQPVAKPPLAFRLSEWISDEKAHQAWREKHMAKITEAPVVREKTQEKLRTTVISRYVLNEKTGELEKVEVPAETPAAPTK
jgi:hypothetical protein